ncbi:hypothetical protein JZ751_009307 [Albula glossodonta]|uniref:Uncharacterized protein n=1 Tax=Albula glossodonta TaxID=121402 RepID=A0A8T2N5Z0_9TELE|nr:hypothetical protein JZ751_009307 [Albula glossodonta]
MGMCSVRAHLQIINVISKKSLSAAAETTASSPVLQHFFGSRTKSAGLPYMLLLVWAMFI